MNTPSTAGECGGSSGIDVQENNVDVVNPATILDFTGTGVSVTDGGGGKAIINIPGGALGTEQAFQYTVVGTEPDLENLVIALPSARANATYLVFPSQATFTNLLAMAVTNASRTTTQFVLSLSADATAGDVFSFLVVDHT